MELRCYEGPQDLEGGFFNIMEPVGKAFSNYEEIDVAVIPGMAFDGRCNRLGRGRGYYDRLLPKLPQAYKIGICFDFQKLPGIPADEHDIKVDEIV
jgi:5-formyltetrahydrofolate cyclo-ligase